MLVGAVLSGDAVSWVLRARAGDGHCMRCQVPRVALPHRNGDGQQNGPGCEEDRTEENRETYPDGASWEAGPEAGPGALRQSRAFRHRHRSHVRLGRAEQSITRPDLSAIGSPGVIEAEYRTGKHSRKRRSCRFEGSRVGGGHRRIFGVSIADRSARLLRGWSVIGADLRMPARTLQRDNRPG